MDFIVSIEVWCIFMCFVSIISTLHIFTTHHRIAWSKIKTISSVALLNWNIISFCKLDFCEETLDISVIF